MRTSALLAAVFALIVAVPSAGAESATYRYNNDGSMQYNRYNTRDYSARTSRSYDYMYSNRYYDDGGRSKDTKVTRYGELDGYYVSDPVEFFFRTAPFTAARAELHPYFRNSASRGYLPYGQITHPGYQLYVRDLQVRQQLGVSNTTASPSVACRNYTTRSTNSRFGGVVESCY